MSVASITALWWGAGADRADPRGQLRTAQVARDQAAQAAQRAAGAAERARGAVGAAQAVLARYDGVDASVARHIASGLRNGSAARALPADIVAARAEQDRHRRDLADAQGAAGLLEQEAAEARAALAAAEGEVASAADAVAQHEASALFVQMREHEAAAARSRMLLGGFLAGRTANSPRLENHELVVMGMDVHHLAIMELGPKLGVTVDTRAWSKFVAALRTDPAAPPPS